MMLFGQSPPFWPRIHLKILFLVWWSAHIQIMNWIQMHLNHKTKNVFFFHYDGKAVRWAFIPLTSLQADYSAFTVCSVFSFDLLVSVNCKELVYLLMAIFPLNHDVLDCLQCLLCQPNVQASNSRIVKSLVSDRLQLLKVKQGLLLPNNNLSSTHKPKWPLGWKETNSVYKY